MTQKQKKQNKFEKEFRGMEIGSKKNKSRLTLLNRSLMAIIAIVGLYFVASINDLSIKGFILQDLKYESGEISHENKEVELKIMKNETYEHINEKALSLNMVKVNKIDYIAVNQGQMAKK